MLAATNDGIMDWNLKNDSIRYNGGQWQGMRLSLPPYSCSTRNAPPLATSSKSRTRIACPAVRAAPPIR